MKHVGSSVTFVEASVYVIVPDFCSSEGSGMTDLKSCHHGDLKLGPQRQNSTGGSEI